MKISVIFPALFTDEWQPKLARFAIETLRDKTQVEFELVVVETGSKMLADVADVHVHMPEVTYITRDLNCAIDKASGDHLVHTGTDVIVGDRWLECMEECFARFPDCGAATLRIAESGAYIGPKTFEDSFDEAMYGPLMMWTREKGGQEWRFDEAFEEHSADSDLVMRMYGAGLRSYRNNRAMAWHLNKVTYSHKGNLSEKEMKAHRLFNERHGRSPLWMARMIQFGGVVYGKEHDRSRLLYTDVMVKGKVVE